MTLTEAAKITKKGLVVFAAVFLVGLSSWLGYRYYYYNIYLPSLPKVEEKPDVKFGLLPALKFDSSSVSSSNFSYSLDTVTGDLPIDLPKIMKVYFAQAGNTTLLSPDRARDLADSFIFPNGPERITPTQYKYTDDNGGEILIDLNTGNFKFERAESSPSGQLTQNFISEQGAVDEFRSFLSNKVSTHGLQGRGKAVFDKSSPSRSTKATVSIWPNNIGDYLVITPKDLESSVRAKVTTFKDPQYRYTSLNFVFWPVDTSTFATYYIKSANQAFTDLKAGEGSVVTSPADTGKVSLTSVYLAYYQQESYTPYIQPIYIFEGENFKAYVSAIDKQYLAPNQ